MALAMVPNFFSKGPLFCHSVNWLSNIFYRYFISYLMYNNNSECNNWIFVCFHEYCTKEEVFWYFRSLLYNSQSALLFIHLTIIHIFGFLANSRFSSHCSTSSLVLTVLLFSCRTRLQSWVHCSLCSGLHCALTLWDF